MFPGVAGSRSRGIRSSRALLLPPQEKEESTLQAGPLRDFRGLSEALHESGLWSSQPPFPQTPSLPSLGVKEGAFSKSAPQQRLPPFALLSSSPTPLPTPQGNQHNDPFRAWTLQTKAPKLVLWVANTFCFGCCHPLLPIRPPQWLFLLGPVLSPP